MCRADTRVIQTCRYGINRGDLPEVVLAEVGFHAVEDAESSGSNRCRGVAAVHAPPGSFAADQANGRFIQEMVEREVQARMAAQQNLPPVLNPDANQPKTETPVEKHPNTETIDRHFE